MACTSCAGRDFLLARGLLHGVGDPDLVLLPPLLPELPVVSVSWYSIKLIHERIYPIKILLYLTGIERIYPKIIQKKKWCANSLNKISSL